MAKGSLPVKGKGVPGPGSYKIQSALNNLSFSLRAKTPDISKT